MNRKNLSRLFTVTLKDEMYDRIYDAAKERDTSMGSIIRELLETALNQNLSNPLRPDTPVKPPQRKLKRLKASLPVNTT